MVFPRLSVNFQKDIYTKGGPSKSLLQFSNLRLGLFSVFFGVLDVFCITATDCLLSKRAPPRGRSNNTLLTEIQPVWVYKHNLISCLTVCLSADLSRNNESNNIAFLFWRFFLPQNENCEDQGHTPLWQCQPLATPTNLCMYDSNIHSDNKVLVQIKFSAQIWMMTTRKTIQSL